MFDISQSALFRSLNTPELWYRVAALQSLVEKEEMAKNKIHSQIPHLNDFLHKSLTLTPLLKSQLQHHRPR
uniref:Uncharacterized protein n=1 Tax=Physcomitrium patens TaxID=3218 RepID=A0A2K1J750_PHYPA|nr:hypothetical protein PHYPA_020458 [Physcomitrium patens]